MTTLSTSERPPFRLSSRVALNASGATTNALTEQEMRDIHRAALKMQQSVSDDVAKAFGCVSTQAQGTSVAMADLGKAVSKLGASMPKANSLLKELAFKTTSSPLYTYKPSHLLDAMIYGTGTIKLPNPSLDIPSTPTPESQSW